MAIPPISPAGPAIPYVGPRPFETGERIFGRDRETSDLYYLLSAERIVLLHSPSGAGKSSLIQAGLIPRMRQEFDVWRPTRVSTPLPETAAKNVNRYVLSAVQGFEQGVPESLRRPVEQLARQSLGDYVRNRPRRPSARENVLLIFDQFEELLTIDPLQIEAKERFFNELGELLRDRRIWALFGMREDYLAAFDPYAVKVPTHFQNRFRIDRLTVKAAAEAIAEPARACGRPFTQLALARLVHDLARVRVQQPDGSFQDCRGIYVEPLQLQVVCSGMWKAMPAETNTGIGEHRIDRKCVRRYGNVSGALAGYYATEAGRIAAGDKHVERSVREWMNGKLILPGEIRGQVLKGKGRTEGLDNGLIAGLENAHLIRGEQRAGATWFELSHDRLIDPVQTSNREWLEANLDPVEKLSAIWDKEGHHEGLLLLGEDLVRAREWRKTNNPAPKDREFRFIVASENKQRRIQRDRRDAVLLKVALYTSLLLLAAAVAGVFFAYRQTQEANAASANSAIANAGSLLNPRLHRYRMDGALAYIAGALRDQPSSKIARYWLSNLLLYGDWYSSYQITAQAQKQGSINFSTDGRFALIQDPNLESAANARVKETETGKITAQMKLHELVLDAVFSPGGELVLIPFRDGSLELWSATGHRTVLNDGKARMSVTFAAFSVRGNWLVAGLIDARKQSSTVLWRIHPPDASIQDRKTLNSKRPSQVAAFSPDELSLVTASDGGVTLWRTESGSELANGSFKFRGSSESVNFSPDGSRVLVAFDTLAQVLDAHSLAVLGQRLEHPDVVTSATFIPGSPDYLMTSCNDSSVRVWDFERGAEIASIPHSSPVYFAQIVTGEKGTSGYVAITASANAVQAWRLEKFTESLPTGSPLPDAEPLHSGTFLAEDFGMVTTSGDSTDHGMARKWWLTRHSVPPPRPGPGKIDPHDSLVEAIYGTNGKRLVAIWGTMGGRSEAPAMGGGDLAPEHHQIQLLDPETGGAIGEPILNAKLQSWNDEVSMLVTSSGNLLQLWDARGGLPRRGSRIAGKGPIRGGDLSKDGNVVVALSDEIKIHDVRKGDLPPLDPMPNVKNVYLVCISDDGSKLLTAFDDGTLQFWDPKTGKEIPGTRRTNKQRFDWANFSTDGRRAVAWSAQTVWVYTVGRSGDTTQVNLQYPVANAQLSSDGLRMVTTTANTAEIWDTVTGRSITGPLPHNGALNSVVLNSEGSLMASAYDRYIQLWDAKTGSAIGLPMSDDRGHADVTAIAFSQDGKRLLSIDSDGSTRAWPILIGSLGSNSQTGALIRLAEAVAGTRITPADTLETIPTLELNRLKAKLRADYGLKDNQALLKEFLDFLSPGLHGGK